MEDKSPKQPIKDHHGFFTVVFNDCIDQQKELAEQPKDEQSDSEE